VAAKPNIGPFSGFSDSNEHARTHKCAHMSACKNGHACL